MHVQSAHGDDDYKLSTIKSKDVSGDWSLQLCRQLLVSFSKIFIQTKVLNLDILGCGFPFSCLFIKSL